MKDQTRRWISLFVGLPKGRLNRYDPTLVEPFPKYDLAFRFADAVSKVKKATSHLKGLKIAIMGCIVNGPGEMADADYGYVGAGPGKITLYKNREVVKKNIPEEKAVEELIQLIKDCGDWDESI